MSYATGGLIEATDYNNLAWGGTQGTYRSSPTNIAYVMGVGNGDFGYGQAISAINNVAATNTVTATQWSGLLTNLNKALGHQSGAGAQLSAVATSITAGNVITAFSNVATAVTTINTNKALFTAQGSTTTGSTNTWNPTAAATASLGAFVDTNVNFSSANAARYFFNAGGQINFVCSATDAAGTTRSTTLRDMVNQIGGLSAFRNTTNGGRTGTGGTVTQNTSFGYRNLIFNNPQNVVNVDVAGTYSAHDVLLQLFANNSDTTNGSITSSICFRLYLGAAADDAFGGAINLTISTRADIVFPSTTYLSNSWGTPTVSFDNA